MYLATYQHDLSLPHGVHMVDASRYLSYDAFNALLAKGHQIVHLAVSWLRREGEEDGCVHKNDLCCQDKFIDVVFSANTLYCKRSQKHLPPQPRSQGCGLAACTPRISFACS